jgi:hypothetical protein
VKSSTKQTASRRGNYSILFTLLVPVTFGFCALSVDLSYMQFTQTQLQHVADAASHAALVRYRQTSRKGKARRSATKVVDANFVGAGHATLDLVEFGRFQNGTFTPNTPDINATRAHVSRVGQPTSGGNGIPLFFAPMLGVIGGSGPTWTYFEPTAVAMTSGRVREICIAQDITGSFSDDIGYARQAALAFLDYFIAQPYPGDKLAMSTFVGGVEPDIWTPLSDVDTQSSVIDGQWSTLDSCNCDRWHYRSGPNWCINYYGNYNGQPWMQDCYDYGSMTSQGPGIDQCAEELMTNGNPTAFKAIILISDGLPCCNSNTAARAQMARDAADNAWDNDIHLWSVAYMNGGGDFSFLQSLVRGYGVAFETPDPAELEEIMIEIANSIPIVLVE